MSNTSKGRGKKGSKCWMQIVVEVPKLQAELNREIGEDLTWISPLAGENEEFAEYELQHKYVRERIGLSEEETKELFCFWPKRQPQWDGLALSKDEKTLYIVEAKAHTGEMNSKLSAQNPKSIEMITKAMKEVHDTYYAKGDFDAWIKSYYQLGNRLTFLQYLNQAPFGKIEKVKLVLLNFVNDTTHRPTSLSDWEEHYREVFGTMIGEETTPENVLVVYFDVEDCGVKVDSATGRPVF